MNRLAQAFVCLTDPNSKKLYDANLLGVAGAPLASTATTEEEVVSLESQPWLAGPSSPPPLPPSFRREEPAADDTAATAALATETLDRAEQLPALPFPLTPQAATIPPAKPIDSVVDAAKSSPEAPRSGDQAPPFTTGLPAPASCCGSGMNWESTSPPPSTGPYAARRPATPWFTWEKSGRCCRISPPAGRGRPTRLPRPHARQPGAGPLAALHRKRARVACPGLESRPQAADRTPRFPAPRDPLAPQTRPQSPPPPPPFMLMWPISPPSF